MVKNGLGATQSKNNGAFGRSSNTNSRGWEGECKCFAIYAVMYLNGSSYCFIAQLA